MTDAVGIIRAVVRDQLRAFRTAELGVVTRAHCREAAGDLNNYACDVRLRDSGLELKRVPVCTPRVGAVAAPDPGDLVVVQFLHGDVNAAVVVGRVYSDQTRPPEAGPREWVYTSAHPPEAGVRRLALNFPNGNALRLDDDALVIEMGATTVTVTHGGDVVIDSAAKLTVTTAGDAAIKAGGNLDLSAGGDVRVEGANVAVKGSAQATVEGGATATVKAASVKLAGKTDFSPA